jgi:D-2-hydroxyacid dehydrogenase (NADP+)
LCSDTAFARYGAGWESTVPGLQTVQLRPGTTVADDDIARIDIGFFSGDLFPDRVANFLRVALDAPNLRWLHVANAGVDHPVFGQFREHGVRLTTSSGSSATPIAHTVIMHLLNMCRATRRYDADQRAHRWDGVKMIDVEGRTIGIVGLGAIGTEVARLAEQFGMTVIGVRRTPTGEEPCETWPTTRLAELLPLVDDLVLAAPLNDETRRMIGPSQIASFQPGAHIVNVGRGELIDEQALIAALQSGQVGAAALDVFVVEPLPADSPLWDMPNVVVTPHSAGTTPITIHRAAEMFVANLAAYVLDRPLRNEVP